MKKLLLLINLFSIILLFTFCKNSSITKRENINEQKIIKSTYIIDSTKNKVQTESSGTVGNNRGVKKDSISKNTKKGNAIIHLSPDQAKIDSIINIKTKSKQ
jgi:hypothetical protein